MTKRMMLALFACNRPEFLRPCLQSIYTLTGDIEPHIFMDAGDEEPECLGLVLHSQLTHHVERERKGLGFQRRKALRLFLERPEAGDYFVMADADTLTGPETLDLLRGELEFWWNRGVLIGMLCCGCQPGTTACSRTMIDGHVIIRNHGGETFAMLPRPVLERTGVAIGENMLGATAPLKNALTRMGCPRAVQLEPMPPVQHIGAFKSVLSPTTSVARLLFYDLQGKPLNPRPDLYNVCKQPVL